MCTGDGVVLGQGQDIQVQAHGKRRTRDTRQRRHPSVAQTAACERERTCTAKMLALIDEAQVLHKSDEARLKWDP